MAYKKGDRVTIAGVEMACWNTPERGDDWVTFCPPGKEGDLFAPRVDVWTSLLGQLVKPLPPALAVGDVVEAKSGGLHVIGTVTDLDAGGMVRVYTGHLGVCYFNPANVTLLLKQPGA
jgi:hypothetical protein